MCRLLLCLSLSLISSVLLDVASASTSLSTHRPSPALIPTTLSTVRITKSTISNSTTTTTHTSTHTSLSLAVQSITSTPPAAETIPPIITPDPVTSGFSTVAICGVLAGTAFLLLCVLIIGLSLRRHKRKRYQKMLEEATSSKTNSPKLQNGSLKGIVVTKEVESSVVTVKMEDFDAKTVRHKTSIT